MSGAMVRQWFFAWALLVSAFAAAEPLPVVASFSILADLTQRVGGDRVKVTALVGANADAHVYQPTPGDAKTLAQARLVVINGLGFEGWLERLVKSSGYKGEVVVASRGVRPLGAVGHHHTGHHHAGQVDPHAWLDPANAVLYVNNIARALGEADPAGEPVYREQAARLIQDIQAAEAEVRTQMAAVPESRRVVVCSHESLAYFGRAFGIRFVSPVGKSTEASASAAEMAKLIRQIKQNNIPAVFLENISNARLLERISRETGATLGGTLYSDALSFEHGPAASYTALMRHNGRTLAAALRP